jgi:hypothetical protein
MNILVISAITCIAVSLVCMFMGFGYIFTGSITMPVIYIIAGYSFSISAAMIGIALAMRGE